MGLWRVLSDLEEDGYRTEWGLFSAEETGAPHQRIRVFILAYTASREPRQSQARNGGQDIGGGSEEARWPARPGEEQYEWEEPRVTEAQSELGGAVDGSRSGVDAITNRVDRLRLLGNGVCPQTAEIAWRTLWKEIEK